MIRMRRGARIGLRENQMIVLAVGGVAIHAIGGGLVPQQGGLAVIGLGEAGGCVLKIERLADLRIAVTDRTRLGHLQRRARVQDARGHVPQIELRVGGNLVHVARVAAIHCVAAEMACQRNDVLEAAIQLLVVAIQALRLSVVQQRSIREFQPLQPRGRVYAAIQDTLHVRMAEVVRDPVWVLQVTGARAIHRRGWLVRDDADLIPRVAVGAAQPSVRAQPPMLKIGADKVKVNRVLFRVVSAQPTILVAEQTVVGILGDGARRCQPGDEAQYHHIPKSCESEVRARTGAFPNHGDLPFMARTERTPLRANQQFAC